MGFTTTTLVAKVLGNDYGANEDGSLPDLQQFIDSAHVVMLRVQTMAITRKRTLTSDELEIVERWLSAHLYCQSDKALQSKSSGGASGSYQGTTGMSLDSTRYGQTAVNLDYSGALNTIGKRAFARGFTLGCNS